MNSLLAQTHEIPIPILLLVEIKRRGGVKAKDLEISLKISTSTVYTNLYKLMSEGYIRKEGDRYIITEKGIEYLGTIKNLYKEVIESI